MSNAQLVNGNKGKTLGLRNSKSNPESKNISNNAHELFTIWTDMQKDILRQGKRINNLIKQIDPKVDEACIGVGNRASGILVYRPDGKVLLGLRDKELIVPGGKCQGEESPIETAVREFKEEFLVNINSKDILDNPQLCYYIANGKYTLYFISAECIFCDSGKIIDEYKKTVSDTLLLSHENPSELMWVDLYKCTEVLNNFTMIIRESIGVKNFFNKLLQNT